MSLTITRPVLVGTTNILTATKDQLAVLIREAQNQISNNKDLSEISDHYKVQKEELEETIKLCVEQLDKK